MSYFNTSLTIQIMKTAINIISCNIAQGSFCATNNIPDTMRTLFCDFNTSSFYKIYICIQLCYRKLMSSLIKHNNINQNQLHSFPNLSLILYFQIKSSYTLHPSTRHHVYTVQHRPWSIRPTRQPPRHPCCRPYKRYPFHKDPHENRQPRGPVYSSTRILQPDDIPNFK